MIRLQRLEDSACAASRCGFSSYKNSEAAVHSCKQDPQPPLSFYMALNNCKLKIKLTAD